MLNTIEFDGRAYSEAQKAVRWYAKRSRGVAIRFAVALEASLMKISQAPESFPVYLAGTRVLGVPRFPYMIIYLHSGDAIKVVAFAHAKRRPGYWRKRLTS
jgi:plasmid stabilization system protein ParE